MRQLGRVIEDKYEVLAKLREGGMGAIYQVRHRLLDEIRIVKVMRQGAEGDEELRKRFLEEAKTATRLKHPNICTIYDFAMDDDGTAYLVMEFIDGITLSDLLKTKGSPGLGLALRMASQALRALAYLHRKNVVHRDIAPDNLMLTADDEGEALVKLIDLGIAKVLDRKVEMTSSGVFLGKVRYASPEQFGMLSPGEMIDGRSDLYSLSLVLYELLTGRKAFLGETPVELMRAHVFQEPLAFAESDPSSQIPEAVRALVLKALRKKREERFASAGEFAREIETVLANLASPPELASGEELIHTVRLSRRPPADPVTPGVQEMLNKPFLGQVTPAPSSGLELISDTVHRTSFLKEIADREARNDISGLESLRSKAGDDSLAKAVQSAIEGLRRKVEEEKLDEEADWTRAIEEYSEEGWNRYLARHVRSARSEEARGRLAEVRAFRESLGHDSLPSWESFLSQWPKGHFRQRVEERLVELREEIEREEEANAWSRAEHEASEDAWKGFLEAHPKSSRVEQARGRLEEVRDFQRASKTDSISSWESFCSRWAKGSLRPRADARLAELKERAAFDSAETSAKASGWRDFLQRFPRASLAAVARARMEERSAFESAAQADTEAAWYQYLRSFGREAGAAEARERLAGFERRDQEEYGRAIAEATSEALRRYLGARPSSKNRAAAQAALAETTAFEKAFQEGEEALEKFGRSYPQSRFRDRAQARRKELQAESALRRQQREREEEEADWSKADSAPSEEAWQRFLERWPKSPRREEAAVRLAVLRERAAYESVLATESWAVCREFLEQFPRSSRADEVRNLLEERRSFERASEAKTQRAWSDFLNRFPNSARSALARQQLEGLRAEEGRALTAAINAKSAEALERFLGTSPEASNRLKAQKLLEETRAYESARSGGQQPLEEYLRNHPEGLYAAEARRLIEDFRQNDLIEQIGQAESAGQTAVLRNLAEQEASSRAGEAARSALAGIQERRRQANEEADWSEAQSRDESGTWKAFLEAHPQSPRASEARRLLLAAEKRDAEQKRRKLEEEKAWQRALKSNSEKGWERFLDAHPASSRAPQVRLALAQLRAKPEIEEPRPEPEKTKVLPVEPEAVREAPAAESGAPAKRRFPVAVMAAVAVVLLAVAAFFYFRSPAAPVLGSLAIDAVPWARIVAIEDASGKNVLGGREEYTPASFELPAGRYKIRLADPTASGKEMSLSAEVSVGNRTVSTNRSEPIDAASYLESEGWTR